jgi:DNA-binding transcriptional LysR family regulator
VPSLAHLQTFLAVYRSGSLTAAAARLHLSQAAVSGHLRALETERGRVLFVRQARGVIATPEAESLAADIGPHLDALAAIGHGSASAPAAATVHLGGPADMLSARALPSLAPVVGQQIRIRTRTGTAEGLMAALRKDELDLVIATRRIPDPRIIFEPLLAETLVLVAAPSVATRVAPHGTLAAPELLDDIPLVAFDEDLPLFRDYWQARFERKLGRRPAITVSDLRGICRTVAAGAGIGVVPRYVASEQLSAGTLSEIRTGPVAVTNQIHLAYAASSLDRAGVDQVRRVLLQTAPGWDHGR